MPPWLRLPADGQPGQPVSPIAITSTLLLGQEAIKFLAVVCPATDLSVSAAMLLGDRLDAGLVLFEDTYVLRLVLPAAALDWDVIRRVVEHLSASVRFVRSVITRLERDVTSSFPYYGDK